MHGVTDGVSRQLARQYTTSVLSSRIEQFERLVKSGQLTVRKTPAHALVHLIKNADQYPDSAVGKTITLRPETPRVPARESDETAVPSWSEELARLSPDDAATFTVKRVSLLYSKKFTLSEFDTLRDLVLRGRLDPAQVIEEAHRRLTALDAQGFIDDLKDRLRSEVEVEPMSAGILSEHS
ncbi:hypothetical protein DEMA109039_21125 [Deinococcus marmoris]